MVWTEDDIDELFTMKPREFAVKYKMSVKDVYLAKQTHRRKQKRQEKKSGK